MHASSCRGNNPSSEPAAADGLGPNGAAFKQSCVFTLIGMKPRWRMDGMGAEELTALRVVHLGFTFTPEYSASIEKTSWGSGAILAFLRVKMWF